MKTHKPITTRVVWNVRCILFKDAATTCHTKLQVNSRTLYQVDYDGKEYHGFIHDVVQKKDEQAEIVLFPVLQDSVTAGPLDRTREVHGRFLDEAVRLTLTPDVVLHPLFLDTRYRKRIDLEQRTSSVVVYVSDNQEKKSYLQKPYLVDPSEFVRIVLRDGQILNGYMVDHDESSYTFAKFGCTDGLMGFTMEKIPDDGAIESLQWITLRVCKMLTKEELLLAKLQSSGNIHITKKE